MFNVKTALTAAVAATGLFFAAPASSQAQSFGLSLNLGRSGLSFYQNDYRYPSYGYTPPVYRDVYSYSPYRTPYRYNSGIYSGYGYGSHSIVHPEGHYWSPRSGWHTHGHIHVYTPSGRHVQVPY